MLLIPFFYLDEFVATFCRSLPYGRLYNYARQQGSNLYNFLSGLLSQLYLQLQYLQTLSYSLFIIPGQPNAFLLEWLSQYGLPNNIFPDVSTAEKALVAINAMQQIPYLITKSDIENFFALLGIIAVISYPSDDIEHSTFPEEFPVEFGLESYPYKFTVIITVSPASDAPLTDAFPEEFPWYFFGSVDTSFVENLCQYLFPCYIYVIVVNV